MFESKTPFESNTFKRAYLFGSVIVWVSILIGTALILSGTPYFAQILPILFVGLIWFIVLLPANFWTVRSRTSRLRRSKRSIFQLLDALHGLYIEHGERRQAERLVWCL